MVRCLVMTAPGHLLLEVFQARPIGQDPLCSKTWLKGAYIISGVRIPGGAIQHVWEYSGRTVLTDFN